jgi:hypothetical protein
MSEITLGDFLKDTKPGGNGNSAEHLNLKALGKAIVFLHPGAKIYKRNAYWFPYYGTVEKNGSKTTEVHDRMIVCPGLDKNPIAQLRKALRDDKSIDLDEVILKVGKGSDAVEYLKGDIIGEDGYDWKKNLAYKTEYLFGVINKDEPKAVHPFVAPKSLGKRITKVIEDQIEDEGDVEGNPFLTPYAFKLGFNKSLPANEMYSAAWNKAEVTPEIKALLEGPGPDNKPLIEPTPIPMIAWLLREALAYDADELKLDLSAADEFNPEDLNRRSNSDEETTEEKAPAKKEKKETPASKGKVKKEKETKRPETKVEDEEEEDDDLIECPECGEEIAADSETCPSCGEDVSPF